MSGHQEFELMYILIFCQSPGKKFVFPCHICGGTTHGQDLEIVDKSVASAKVVLNPLTAVNAYLCKAEGPSQNNS